MGHAEGPLTAWLSACSGVGWWTSLICSPPDPRCAALRCPLPMPWRCMEVIGDLAALISRVGSLSRGEPRPGIAACHRPCRETQRAASPDARPANMKPPDGDIVGLQRPDPEEHAVGETMPGGTLTFDAEDHFVVPPQRWATHDVAIERRGGRQQWVRAEESSQEMTEVDHIPGRCGETVDESRTKLSGNELDQGICAPRPLEGVTRFPPSQTEDAVRIGHEQDPLRSDPVTQRRRHQCTLSLRAPTRTASEIL